MRKFFGWAKGFFSENGEASSKRFVGVLLLHCLLLL